MLNESGTGDSCLFSDAEQQPHRPAPPPGHPFQNILPMGGRVGERAGAAPKQERAWGSGPVPLPNKERAAA